MSALDDCIIEAILGSKLTRKLDDHFAQEEVLDPDCQRMTRMEVVRGGVETLLGIVKMRNDANSRDDKRALEMQALFAEGKTWAQVQAALRCSRSTIVRTLQRHRSRQRALLGA